MAKTISELRNQSIQVRDASAAGENTATRVGTVLNDIVGHIEDYENTQSSNNSSQDAKIEGVKSSLDAEIARAKTEESNLRTQIGTERTERQAAVSREETARIKADNDEKTARENADITLRTMIQTEVSNRQIAVKQEEIRAKAAEQANAQAIADENARATAEEQRLQGNIDNTNDNLNSLDDKVNSNHDHLTYEVARLDTTDNEIKADLEAETARAKAAEEANAQAIAEEKAAIMGTDRIADGAVTTEKITDAAVTYDKLQAEINEVIEGTRYTENPEFLRYYCDADSRLIWWIYPDGSVDWAKGVPAPIQEELRKLEQLIKDNTEGDESVVERLTANEASIVAINDALGRKVDGVYEESSEYVRLNKDADGRTLNGIKADGTNYMPKADIDTLSLNGKEIDNGSIVVNKHEESSDYIRYYCDSDDRLIWWIYPDGSVDWAKGVPQPIQEELKKMEQLMSEKNSYISDSIGFGNNYNLIDRHSGKQSDFIYSSGYFGYKTPVKSKSIIQSISFSMWKDNDENYPSTIEVIIGEVDQRNWLLPRTTVIADVTLNNNVLTAKPRKTTFINENEVAFIHVTQKRNITLKLTDEVVDINNRGCYTSSLDSAIREVNTNRDFSNFIVSLTEYTGYFVTTSEIETIDTKIKLLSNETSKINKYTDVVTGEKYKIRIVNGEIKLVSNNFKNLLVISHSFGNYTNSPSADWYLDNDENRAMAPSVYDKEFSWFLTQALGLSSWKRLSGVDWERNYTNFDFETKWALQDTWDAIVVFLGENMQTTEGLSEAAEKAMLYLLKACPSAEIFWCTCWQSNKAEKYIEAATNVPDITLVNTLKSGVDNNRWKKGDYYIGRDSIYYPIGAPYSHPNDMGHLMIAKEILEAMGKSDNTPIYKITLTQTDGGLIETPNINWLAGSVVTIRCKATEGNYINGVSVSATNGETVQATLRVNSFGVYYTFIMPEADVIVTPTWSNTKNYTTYNVSVSDTSGGTLTILNSTTLEGTRVYVYAKPSDGKVLGNISASTDSEQIQLTADGNNTYYFTMPANNVVITPVWE